MFGERQGGEFEDTYRNSRMVRIRNPYRQIRRRW